MNGVILAACIGGISLLGLNFLRAQDPEHGLRRSVGIYWFVCGYSLLTGFYLAGLHRLNWLEKMGFACLASCLLISTVTDVQTRKVYDFLPVAGVAAGGLLLLMHPPGAAVGAELIIFCLLQYFVFRSMYGDADVMSFMMCAVFESLYGQGLKTYLLHMAAAFSVLAIVQLVRGNVSKSGNLREPVAFLPYISMSVWFFV